MKILQTIFHPYLLRLHRATNSSPSTNGRCRPKKENARNGLPETDWRDAQYDMLYLPVTETVRYHYDLQRNPHRHRPAPTADRSITCITAAAMPQISLDDEVHHRHRTRSAAPRNLPHTGVSSPAATNLTFRSSETANRHPSTT